MDRAVVDVNDLPKGVGFPLEAIIRIDLIVMDSNQILHPKEGSGAVVTIGHTFIPLNKNIMNANKNTFYFIR